MANIANLLTEHMAIWSAADTEKKLGRGRASGNAGSVYGVKKLRELILELAVRGKLVPQDPNDEPASELLKRIQAEKAKLIAEGKLKKEKPLATIGEDEKPFELPERWEWVRLGLITNFGLTEKLNKINNDTWVLDLEDIEKDTSVILQKNRFSDKQSLSDKNSFKKGDVLYGKLRPYLNKVVVADEDGVCTTEILPIRCYGDFDNKYFMYALKAPHFISYVNARSYGMKMPRLGTDDGKNSLFPLAPITEQHRIVAKVDALMALCDQLEQQHSNAQEAHETLVSQLLATLTQSQNAAEFNVNWQRIYAHFEVLFTTESSIDALKQTLLQLAVMGKLVPQDPSDEPASELLKRIQVEKAKLIAEGKLKKEKPLTVISEEEKPFHLPDGWAFAFITQVVSNDKYSIKRGPFGSAIKKDYFVNEGFKVYEQQHAINDNFYLGHYYIDKTKFEELSAFEVKAKDIIISCSGTVGRVAIAPSDMEAGIINQALLKITLNESVLINRYFKILFPAFFMKTDKLSDLSGTAQKNIVSVDELKNEPFPLPPLAEQHRIVAKVDALMALCDQLKTRIQQANQQQQAIADALVAQAVA